MISLKELLNLEQEPEQEQVPQPTLIDQRDLDTKSSLLFALASLRALYIVHQNSHWQTKGATFYSDHLMFQRLYESAGTDTDTLAERIAGIHGSETLAIDVQIAFLHKCVAQVSQEQNLVLRGILAEQKAIESIQKSYYSSSYSGELTLGLDDLLLGLCSNRETSIYLLKQRNSSTTLGF